MGQAGTITVDHANTIKKVGPKAATSLLQQPQALDRFLKDVNFPPRTSEGELVGKGSFQIVFDRKLGSEDEANNDVAAWLYLEWGEVFLEGGDKFILASGTINDSQDVEVSAVGLAVVQNDKSVSFHKAGRVTLKGDNFSKTSDLDEAEFCSSLSSFRSSVSKGATMYSGEMEAVS